MLFAALAKNAGAIAVALEPRGWDEGGAYDKHKRPDIEWINAATRRFTITDVTIDWTMTVGSGTEHAEGAEKRKVDAYKTAMQRNRESAARARRQPDDFAPLGFAKNGAWGPQAQRIFKDLCAMLSVRTMSADLRAPHPRCSPPASRLRTTCPRPLKHRRARRIAPKSRHREPLRGV